MRVEIVDSASVCISGAQQAQHHLLRKNKGFSAPLHGRSESSTASAVECIRCGIDTIQHPALLPHLDQCAEMVDSLTCSFC